MTHKEAYNSQLDHLTDTFFDEMDRLPGVQERLELEAQAMAYADDFAANYADWVKDRMKYEHPKG